MASINKVQTVRTHEGGKAQKVSPIEELRRSVLSCLLWENTFYEKGSDIAKRISYLVRVCNHSDVAKIALEARNDMKLRHVPLFLIRELARHGNNQIVKSLLSNVIQRPDDLAEFMAMYFMDGKQPLSRGVKLGLASAFTKFDEYQLAKYNRDGVVKLKDVLFLVHPKPIDEEQQLLWNRLVNGELKTPDTWEVALSGGADKKATFERLLSEGRLGGMAVLRNLRNMLEAGVDTGLIRQRLERGCGKSLPFRFITAARYAPQLEDCIEASMMKSIDTSNTLKGTTGLLIDVSYSMVDKLSGKSDTSRLDAACGLAILLRELCQSFQCATFSEGTVIVPPRRGFALRDAIDNSQDKQSTYLARSLRDLSQHKYWRNIDRLIVITDEQSHDGIFPSWIDKSYLINVASYQNGVGYGNGFHHINGWSENVVKYIYEYER